MILFLMNDNNWFFLFEGFECEAHNNPADFMLDVINLCEEKSPDVEGQICTIKIHVQFLLK